MRAYIKYSCFCYCSCCCCCCCWWWWWWQWCLLVVAAMRELMAVWWCQWQWWCHWWWWWLVLGGSDGDDVSSDVLEAVSCVGEVRIDCGDSASSGLGDISSKATTVLEPSTECDDNEHVDSTWCCIIVIPIVIPISGHQLVGWLVGFFWLNMFIGYQADWYTRWLLQPSS